MFSRVLLVIAILFVAWFGFVHASAASGHGRAYVVKPHDTLWSIAERFYAGDPRRGVWELEHQNDLNGAEILAGQRIIVPG